MTVLSILGKIEPICISKKLKLYIANLPDSPDNDRQSELVYEMKKGFTLKEMDNHHLGIESTTRFKIASLAKYQGTINTDSELSSCLRTIASELIYMYFDYEYDDMPLGGFDTNPFDGRFCEKDYAEKILHFMHFAVDGIESENMIDIPQCAYTSNYDMFEDYRFIFSYSRDVGNAIESFKAFGDLLDNCLENKNDYFMLDYLCNSLYQVQHDDCSTHQFMKLYSLSQLFLEKETESELDWKLPMFLDTHYTADQKRQKAILLRKIRNKIAHGDYVKYESVIEEYAQVILGEDYDFDYSEYSRENWVLLNACVSLQSALQRMIALWLQDKKRLAAIKNKKQND